MITQPCPAPNKTSRGFDWQLVMIVVLAVVVVVLALVVVLQRRGNRKTEVQ